MSIFEGLTISFGNGLEIFISAQTIAILAIVAIFVLAAIAIWVMVRKSNRRDNPRHAKRPPDAP